MRILHLNIDPLIRPLFYYISISSCCCCSFFSLEKKAVSLMEFPTWAAAAVHRQSNKEKRNNIDNDNISILKLKWWLKMTFRQYFLVSPLVFMNWYLETSRRAKVKVSTWFKSNRRRRQLLVMIKTTCMTNRAMRWWCVQFKFFTHGVIAKIFNLHTIERVSSE